MIRGFVTYFFIKIYFLQYSLRERCFFPLVKFSVTLYIAEMRSHLRCFCSCWLSFHPIHSQSIRVEVYSHTHLMHTAHSTWICIAYVYLPLKLWVATSVSLGYWSGILPCLNVFKLTSLHICAQKKNRMYT